MRKLTAVAFTALRWLAIFFRKMRCRHLDIFQVASHVSLVAETGLRKKSVSMQKLKLQESNAENCTKGAVYAAITRQKPFAEKKQR